MHLDSVCNLLDTKQTFETKSKTFATPSSCGYLILNVRSSSPKVKAKSLLLKLIIITIKVFVKCSSTNQTCAYDRYGKLDYIL